MKKKKKKKKYRLKILNQKNRIQNAKKENVKSKTNGKTKKNVKTKKKQKQKRKFWKRLLTFILILCILGVLAFAGFLAYVVISAPKFDETAFAVNDQTVIYDNKGEVITTIGTQKRESITYDRLPQVLIDAIVATEDSKFFQHNGVDLLRFTKATIQQFMGTDAGGASTLTMQVAKNNLTQQGKIEKNIIEKVVRKFHDVYLAVFKIEKKYSKEEIFEFYVNSYYLGGTAWGVQSAAEYYFDKDVSELTLPEASLIAGLFQSPGLDNPYKSIENAEDRRDIVLKLMERHGYITKEEANYARNIPIESLLTTHEENNNYQGYIDTVTVEVQKLTGQNPYTVPMKIYTTMERSIQNGIDKIMTGNKTYKWKDSRVQAGVAIINSQTGAIAAVGAGRNKKGIETFNYATAAKRQPGSTAKPIFAYGPAIEYKNMSSYTLFNDEKWGYSNGVNVNNWNGGYDGMVTMRYALQYSRNIPAIKAIQQVGVDNSYKFAHSLGLDVSLNQTSDNYRVLAPGVDNTVNEAYAIGGVAEGFTPLEMAAAYAAFSNGGYYTTPYSVTKIEFRTTGEVKEYKNTKTRVMKDSTAYIINNILESAVKVGFNGGADVNGSHVAAKTGTSNYPDTIVKKYKLPDNAVNDLWTIAYTSKYAVSVWYGYDEINKDSVKNKAYNTQGSTYKESLTRAIMKYIPKDTKGWTKPSSVVASKVEIGSWPAALPSDYTPSSLITTEYFVRGSEPSEKSIRFEKLDNITNLTNIKVGSNVTLTWDYNTPQIYTDSYLKEYFSQNVFGKGTSSFINSVKNYNLPGILVNGNSRKTFSYGTLGFGIYKKELDGTLTLLGFTTDKTYNLNIYNDTTIVIKAEYQKFKSNASSGISIELKYTETPIIPEKELNIELNHPSVSVPVGEYLETGLKSAYYDTEDVKNLVTIKYQISINNELKEFTSRDSVITYIKTLPAGNYKLNYIVSYLNKEATAYQTITIK